MRGYIQSARPTAGEFLLSDIFFEIKRRKFIKPSYHILYAR
jgi:hypothetical protein